MSGTTRPGLSDVLAASIGDALAPVAPLRVAKIEAYDRTTQTAGITPLPATVRYRLDGTPVNDAPPRIDGVPCLFPAGGGVSLTWDYEPGDLVLVAVRDVSHDEIDGGRVVAGPPTSGRRWDWSDAVVIGGYAAPADPLPSSAVSGSGPVLVLPAADKLRIGSSTAAKALALAESVAAQLARIESAFNAHTHILTIAVGGGSGTAAVPANQVTPTTTPADVSTDLVLVTS